MLLKKRIYTYINYVLRTALLSNSDKKYFAGDNFTWNVVPVKDKNNAFVCFVDTYLAL